MDFSQYIPVLCQTKGVFRGKSYWEKISSVVSHKGKSVARPMTKSDFAEGDEMVVHFRGRDFTGVVKYGEGDIATRSPSPLPAASAEPEVTKSKTADCDTTPAGVRVKSTATVVPASKIHARTPTKKRRVTRKKGECILKCM